MTEYKKEYPFDNLFPPEVPWNTLAQWLSAKSIAQFHCAGIHAVTLTGYTFDALTQLDYILSILLLSNLANHN